MAHSPLPWIAKPESVSDGGHWRPAEIWSEHDSNEPKIVAELAARSSASANARFIVRAVNSFEAMREALETIAGFAPGNGYVCEIIAKRARKALATIPDEEAQP